MAVPFRWLRLSIHLLCWQVKMNGLYLKQDPCLPLVIKNIIYLLGKCFSRIITIFKVTSIQFNVTISPQKIIFDKRNLFNNVLLLYTLCPT